MAVLLTVGIMPMDWAVTKAAASTVHSFDATAQASVGDDKAVIAEGTTFNDGYFKIVGKVTQRTNSDGSIKAYELASKATGAVQFTTESASSVVVGLSSTGGSNESAVALINTADNSVVAEDAGTTVVAGTKKTELKYTALPAGTYQVVSPEDADRNRACRFFDITVEEEEAAAVTTTYAFAVADLSPAAYSVTADKTAIAEGTVFASDYVKTVGTATFRTKSSSDFSALKAIAPLLVFFLVISSLCNAGKSHGGVIKTVIILYMFSTVLAAVIAVFASMAFPVEMTLANAATDTSAPQGIAEVLNNLLLNVVANPVSSLVNANYVGILMWAVLLGLAFRAADKMTKKVLADVADGISMVVTWIINLAPVGIFGLVFNTVSTNGLEIFTTYGKLLLLLVGCMLFIYFVTNPLLVYWCIRQNPYPLIFHCLKRSALTAFFTRSSAANIPVNMKVCEEMGLDRDTYSVTIPLGATINMDGAAITITVMTMATAFTLGINVDIPTAIILSLLAALSACGASGVAGGSLLLIPLACSLFGISDDIAMQVVAVGFIIGVIQDSVETALNSSSDLLLSASAEFRQWRLEGKEIKFK